MEPREVLSLDEIELSDLEFWRRPWEEREGAFQSLRRERPLSFHEEPDMEFMPRGDGYWAVTRHADILEASRKPELYSSAQGATSIGDLPPEFLQFFGSFINMDDPGHLRLRKLVSAGFTPRQLARLTKDVHGAAARTLDAVVEKGECDFVTEISAPFPISIICDMMGIRRASTGSSSIGPTSSWAPATRSTWPRARTSVSRCCRRGRSWPR